MIVLDASVLLASEDADDPNGEAAQALLVSGAELVVLDLTVYEVTNVATMRWASADAGRRLQRRCWAIEADGRIVRVDRALAAEAAALSIEHRTLTAYDAAYVAAASRLGAVLASCDLKDLVRPGFAVLPADVLIG